jgi:hypothetical protein
MSTADIPETTASVAERFLDLANGDIREATRLMEKSVHADRSLFYQLMTPLVHNACYDAIRGVARSKRKILWNTPRHADNDADRQVQRIKAMGTGNLLMFFPLPYGGKPLGEARASDLDDAIAFYKKQSHDMHTKGIWLQLVRNALGSSRKKVCSVLSEEDLTRFEAQAKAT